MTFWLYQPSQFFKSSTILPYRGNDLGDVLNFFTVFLFSLALYMNKVMKNENWKKVLFMGMGFILILSLLSIGSQTETIDGMQVPKYNDYEYSLSVD